VARRRLGAELRALREAAGKRIEDAAETLECSTAKISRLENGKGIPRARDVRDLIALYGAKAKAEQDYLLELAEDGRGQEWWNEYSDVVQGEMFADHLLRYVALEQDADTIRSFESDLISGLLQSKDYTYGLLTTIYPDQAESERWRYVDFRQRRQFEIFQKRARPKLSFIVSEAALIRPIASEKVLRSQLETLHTDLGTRLADVEFRITPLTAQAPGALGGPFSIITFADPTDQDVVYLEGRAGAAYLESDADVARYGRIFAELERDSLSRAESLKRLEGAIKTLS
jgi:transcriptional regulator with XRE-family HTH domain